MTTTNQNGEMSTCGDRLSRAASLVSEIRRSHAYGSYMDAGFDGGEWGGPAHAEQEQRQCVMAVALFGFTPQQYNDELKQRTSHKFAYFHDLFVHAENEN